MKSTLLSTLAWLAAALLAVLLAWATPRGAMLESLGPLSSSVLTTPVG